MLKGMSEGAQARQKAFDGMGLEEGLRFAQRAIMSKLSMALISHVVYPACTRTCRQGHAQKKLEEMLTFAETA